MYGWPTLQTNRDLLQRHFSPFTAGIVELSSGTLTFPFVPHPPILVTQEQQVQGPWGTDLKIHYILFLGNEDAGSESPRHWRSQKNLELVRYS